MKKRTLKLIGVFAAASVLLAGCGSTPAGGEGSSAADSGAGSSEAGTESSTDTGSEGSEESGGGYFRRRTWKHHVSLKQ